MATTFITGTLTGLLADPGGGESAPRRAGVLVALVAGAIGGTLAIRHVRGGAPALPLALLAAVVLAAALRLGVGWSSGRHTGEGSRGDAG